ncbi:HlyC/CorC family transporter [Candidatus Babeliales bacterium]|nr:HlyC/CorC family transporter [Candidatus Babeliales bacterium]
MVPLYLEFIGFIICLFLAGFFAYLETAFTALRLFKLKELESVVSHYRSLFDLWSRRPDRILITILVANNFAHVLCSVLITEMMQKLFGDFGLAIGVAVATVLILIMGDIIPKTLAKTHHERLFTSTLWIINILVFLLRPIVSVLQFISNKAFLFFGGDALARNDQVSEKEIEFLINYVDKKGIMETEKTEMLQNIFGLGQTPVSRVMVSRIDMVMLNIDVTLDDALDIFSSCGYSRIPVYEGKEDNIIGFIYHKDVFQVIAKKQKKAFRDLIRPVFFVPESKKTNQLLSYFLRERMHMAIVVDEHGVTIGLVTLEDVIEEIVGEIRDEHEIEQKGIVSLEDGGWIIDARTQLEELEKVLKIEFVAEHSMTLGGFISEKLEHLPQKGNRLYYQGYCFQIQQASAKRVIKVLVFESKESENIIS